MFSSKTSLSTVNSTGIWEPTIIFARRVGEECLSVHYNFVNSIVNWSIIQTLISFNIKSKIVLIYLRLSKESIIGLPWENGLECNFVNIYFAISVGNDHDQYWCNLYPGCVYNKCISPRFFLLFVCFFLQRMACKKNNLTIQRLG